MSSRRALALLLFASLQLAMAWQAVMAAAPAEAIEAFLPRWRAALAAVEAGDGRPLAELSRLPFLLEGRALDWDGWARAAPRLLDARLRRCLAQAQPQREGEAWLLHCRPYSFYLRTGADGRWRLDGFDADGEDAEDARHAGGRR